MSEEKDTFHFYLLNDGNAINFIHGASIGDFILLVHAELLVAASMMLEGKIPLDKHEIDQKVRAQICATWLKVFKGITVRS